MTFFYNVCESYIACGYTHRVKKSSEREYKRPQHRPDGAHNTVNTHERKRLVRGPRLLSVRRVEDEKRHNKSQVVPRLIDAVLKNLATKYATGRRIPNRCTDIGKVRASCEGDCEVSSSGLVQAALLLVDLLPTLLRAASRSSRPPNLQADRPT